MVQPKFFSGSSRGRDSRDDANRYSAATGRLSKSVLFLGYSQRRAEAFIELVEGIDREVLTAFDQAAWPTDLYPFDLGGEPEAEESPAGAAVDLRLTPATLSA